jgi:hypothetical protein
MKVLHHLCNETTFERKIVLPIPNHRYPELLETFVAKVRFDFGLERFFC